PPVLLVPALCTTRARATPRTAPSSAPITTRSWPSRRSDRFTWPPGRVLDPRYVAEAARAQTPQPLPRTGSTPELGSIRPRGRRCPVQRLGATFGGLDPPRPARLQGTTLPGGKVCE